jgi:hypothetical protein
MGRTGSALPCSSADGITSLRLSLPYHHHRKPPHLNGPSICFVNIGDLIAIAVPDSRRPQIGCRARLQAGGNPGNECWMCIGFLTLSMSAFRPEHLSTPEFFADVVWNGISTQHVRQSLEGGVDLQELRFLGPRSALSFIKRLRELIARSRWCPAATPVVSARAFAARLRRVRPLWHSIQARLIPAVITRWTVSVQRDGWISARAVSPAEQLESSSRMTSSSAPECLRGRAVQTLR